MTLEICMSTRTTPWCALAFAATALACGSANKPGGGGSGGGGNTIPVTTGTGGGPGAGGGGGPTGTAGAGATTGTGGASATGTGGASATGTGGASATGAGGASVTGAGGAGQVVDHGCLLVPTPTGWVAAASNAAHVQGAIYSYQDTSGTTHITPLTDATHPFSNAGDGKLCVKGTAGKVVNADFTTTFGAAMGVDLCHAAPTDALPDMKYTLATCPLQKNLAGIRFALTGASIPTELRVAFHEAARDASTYVLAAQGANTAMFADGKVLYDKTAPPVNVGAIDSIHFTIPTNAVAAVSFDFCVDHIELLTTGGACPDGAKSDPGTGAGGAGGGGGGAGGSSTGGAEAGTLPTNVTAADIASAYAQWKSTYVQTCGGAAYVSNPQDGGSGYSEGIGYGMLLAVGNSDEPTFDALWKFYGAHTDGNGLMNWRIGASCGGVSGPGSATDGDLDAAMALVQASCRWGGTYAQSARDLIGHIKAKEIAVSGGVQVVKPGDGFNDVTCVNPSYFAPGYFRAFGRFTTDAAFWNKVADDSYATLNALSNGTTGLVPNWGHTDKSAPHGECARNEAGLYGYDAARTPWRIATDYRWWGTPAAATYLGKIVTFAKGKGIDSIGDKYNLDGSVVSAFHTPVTVGAFANATVASDAATANAFYQGLKGVSVGEYFPATLKVVYLMFGAGEMARCVP
jgi:endo-1,4-beta-D-glucanase Y